MKIVTQNSQDARALALQRMLLMLYLLKVDYKCIVDGSEEILENIKIKEGKHSQRYKRAKEYFESHSSGFSSTCNQIFKMERLVGNQEGINIIKRDMTSERIADLHGFFDIIMEVENISVLTDIIKHGLSEKTETNE